MLPTPEGLDNADPGLQPPAATDKEQPEGIEIEFRGEKQFIPFSEVDTLKNLAQKGRALESNAEEHSREREQYRRDLESARDREARLQRELEDLKASRREPEPTFKDEYGNVDTERQQQYRDEQTNKRLEALENESKAREALDYFTEKVDKAVAETMSDLSQELQDEGAERIMARFNNRVFRGEQLTPADLRGIARDVATDIKQLQSTMIANLPQEAKDKVISDYLNKKDEQGNKARRANMPPGTPETTPPPRQPRPPEEMRRIRDIVSDKALETWNKWDAEGKLE